MKYLFLFFFISYSLIGFAQNVKPKMKKKKYGFFAKGKKVIPCVYSEVELIKENYYKVKQENKWGVVDTEKQKEIIPCKYDDILRKSENGFIALQEGKQGGISNDGETIVDFNFEAIDHFEMDGSALVIKDGKWGYLENNEIDYESEKIVVTVAEEMAIYKAKCKQLDNNYLERKECSQNEILKHIFQNIKFPNPQARIEGVVIIKFRVTKTGEAKDWEIIKDIGLGYGEEGLRVVKLLKSWSPAIHYGVPIDMYYNIPIKFKLMK